MWKKMRAGSKSSSSFFILVLCSSLCSVLIIQMSSVASLLCVQKNHSEVIKVNTGRGNVIK